MKTNAIVLTNSSAGAPGADIHDISPPVIIPTYWYMLWLLVAALVILAAVFLIVRSQRKRRNGPPPIPYIPPPHEVARQKLQEALELIGQPRPFCIMVSDTIRVYLEKRFKFRAPERTTEEFLRELQATELLLPDQKQSLGDFLSVCDMVKFARYEPGPPELHALHDSAVRLIDETEPRPAPAAPQSASATSTVA